MVVLSYSNLFNFIFPILFIYYVPVCFLRRDRTCVGLDERGGQEEKKMFFFVIDSF